MVKTHFFRTSSRGSTISFLILLLLLSLDVFSANYYVSSTGNDSNSGLSPETPWKSISKVNSIKFIPGDNIFFKRGDVFHGNLKFTNSGTSTNPIIYGAYGNGAEPVLTGYINVSIWTLHSSGIYKANIGSVANLRMVEFNGQIQPKGRYPNNKYLYFESHNGRTSITDNELTNSPNWTGAELVIVSSRWTIDKLPITNHVGTQIFYGGNISYEPRHDDFGYFIQNDLKTLDQIGEWYYDGTFLYVYFGNEIPQNNSVRASTLNDIIFSAQMNYITIENLKIEGSNRYGFYGFVSRDLKIQNCIFEEHEISAIRGQSTRNFTITNNSINYSNNFGIDIDKGEPYATVAFNTIKNTGLFPGMGQVQSIGIRILCDNSIVSQNSIENTGYSPIIFNGSNVLIEKNFINNFCFTLDDGGGIYTYHGLYTDVPKTRWSNRKILNNIVLNGIGIGPSGASKNNPGTVQSAGLFLDGGSGAVEIRGNTVANCGYSGLAILNGHNLLIEDNIFYDNLAQLRLSHRGAQDPIVNVNFKNNIQFSRDNEQLGLHYWVQDLKGVSATTDIANWGTFSNNYYCKPANENQVFLNTGAGGGAYRSLSQWKSYTNHELNSKITPVQVSDLNRIVLIYNETSNNKTFFLNSPAIDVKGLRYTNSVTLNPHSSIILIKDVHIEEDTNNSPIIANQTFNINSVSPGGFIGKVNASDPDAGQSLTYAITGGAKSDLFYIAPTTGNLYTVQSYAGTDLSGTITVQVTDNGNPQRSASATITISQTTTVQNNPPVVSNKTITIGAIGTFKFIDNVGATDPDAGQKLSYKIISGNSSGKFFLNSLGDLYTSGSYNGIDNLSGSLTVEVTDDGTPKLSTTATMTIVHNTNNAPVINAQSFSVGAIAPGGFIGQVTATDPDAGQSLTYAITGGTKSALFYIVSSNGNLYTVPSYTGGDLSGTITVQVTDNGNPQRSASATITISQTTTVQNNPPVISNKTVTIGAIGTFKFIDNVGATDPDAGQKLSYKIISGNSAGRFFLNSLGNLYTSWSYNGIDNLSGSLTVEVTDDGTPKLSSTATITIVHNTNNAPVINAQSFSVGAIAPGGFIGQVTATDPDAGQSLTYAITGGTKSALFYIVPSNGNLYTVQSYTGGDLSGTITVQVTDNGNPQRSASATITISQTTTAQNNPPVISNRTFNIGTIGTFKFIGNVNATDPDAGQKLSYKIISGNSSGKFFLNSIGDLYTSWSYNGIDNLSGSLTVEVTDDGTPKLSSTATITIVHNTNNAPVINAQSFSVGAVAPGGFVGQVTATDADAGQSLTYAITGGTKSTLFYIVPSNGNLYTVQSYTGGDLSGTITVQVTDNGNPQRSASATITISQTTTAQNNPPVISNRTFNIGTIGTFKFIGNVNATDPDAGQKLSYKIISGNSSGKFFLNSIGDLYTSWSYNGIDNLSGSLTVEVTDDGTPKLSTTATITIVHNTNNAPVINAQSFSIGAVTPGGFIGQVTATDLDAGQSLTYAITGGTKSTLFYIVPSNGNLYTVPSYTGSDLSGTITVQVTDNGNPQRSASATITISQTTTVQNNPPVISNKTVTIGAIGTFKFIDNVGATDPDAGQKLSYKIISGNSSGKFFLNSIGDLYTSSTYNGIDNLSGSLTVEVSDNGTPKLSTTATITIVHNTNNAPVINAQSFTIGSIAPGGFIGKVLASDPDASQTLSYRISQGNQAGNFWISPINGNLYTTPSYNPEINLSGIITVEVTDNGSPTRLSSGQITINHSLVSTKGAVMLPLQNEIIAESPMDSELDEIVEVKLYPNPINEFLNIELINSNEKVVLSIIDIKGSIIYTAQFGSLKGNINERINLSQLEGGVYLIRIKSGEEIITRKIIKQ